MKFAIGKASIAALCLTIAIRTRPAYSVTNELVASSESHSIEKSDSSGNWIRTFASTGPWISLGIASSPTTALLTHDYASEIQAASIQPDGLTFGPNNNLTVNSVFNGQVWVEGVEQVGPMNLLASGMTADVGFLALGSDGMLYMPSFHNPEGRGSNFCTFYACMDYDFNSDVVYKINPANGTVTKFITTHIWGPYQMIFVPF